MIERRSFLRSFVALPFAGLIRGAEGSRLVEYRLTLDAIEVVERTGSCSRTIQRVTSRQPSAMVPDLARDLLFVANAVGDHGGLPTGSVESYAVQAATGKLRLISRQALSLAATHPGHLALAPNGEHLVVASAGAGIYNVLPVSVDGEVGRVTQALKVLRTGARLHSFAFDGSGRSVLGRDVEGSLVTVLSFADGQLKRQ